MLSLGPACCKDSLNRLIPVADRLRQNEGASEKLGPLRLVANVSARRRWKFLEEGNAIGAAQHDCKTRFGYFKNLLRWWDASV